MEIREYEITYNYTIFESSRPTKVYAPNRAIAESIARHAFNKTFTEKCRFESVEILECPVKHAEKPND